MPKQAHRPPALCGQVFRGSDAIARGLLTRAGLRTTAWRPLFRDVYADARLPLSHELRCAAARWILPPGGAVAGRSAAVLYGAWQLPPEAPVEVLVPAAGKLGPVLGLILHSGRLAPGEATLRAGTPVTAAPRTCRDLAAWLPLLDAVAVIDALLARHLVSRAHLYALAASRAGRPGYRRLVRAVDLSDARAGSPQESRLRVRLALAGLPPPTAQYEIRSGGRFVARVDFAWPAEKVAVEYDGAWHADLRQFRYDRRRLNQMQAEGWTVLHVTADRLRDDFAGLVAELRVMLDARRPGAARS